MYYLLHTHRKVCCHRVRLLGTKPLRAYPRHMAATEGELRWGFDEALELFYDDADFDRVGPQLVRARDEVEILTIRAVARARERGRSWTDIGAALGVTRQAARQRFDAA